MKKTKLLPLSLFLLSCTAFADNHDSADELDLDLDIQPDETAAPNIPDAVLPNFFKPAEETIGENQQEVNLVEINETFFKVIYDETSNSYQRTETNEAKPGDLIELVIHAENKSDQAVSDVQMVNQIPQGPVTLVSDSFQFDASKSLYRISKSGETYFPADAELDPASIRFIQWHILSLQPGETAQFSYRLQISP